MNDNFDHRFNIYLAVSLSLLVISITLFYVAYRSHGGLL
jgi:hypothetical protein